VYRTRIELRQIGVRDEAKRISGFGICGCKQCCSAFLNEFEQITTQMAKDQQISLNPTKISGQIAEGFYAACGMKKAPMRRSLRTFRRRGVHAP